MRTLSTAAASVTEAEPTPPGQADAGERLGRTLTGVLLAGGGLQAVTEVLSSSTGLAITIETVPGGAIAAAGPPPHPAGAGTVEMVLRDVEHEVGLLRACGPSDAVTRSGPELEQGAALISLELRHREQLQAVADRLHGELLHEMLASDGTPTEELRLRAARANVDLEVPRRVIALRLPPGVEPAYVLQLARSAPGRPPSHLSLTVQRGDVLVAAVTKPSAADAERVVRELQARARRAGISARAGISDESTNLAAALRQATAALRLACQGDDPRSIVVADRLGPLRFLLDVDDSAEMERLVRASLSPVADYDRASSRSALLETLRAFVEADGRRPAVAAACHVHVNTLKYRLSRIEQITGRSLGDPAARFELRLAFSVLDLLLQMGIDPLGPRDDRSRTPADGDDVRRPADRTARAPAPVGSAA